VLPAASYVFVPTVGRVLAVPPTTTRRPYAGTAKAGVEKPTVPIVVPEPEVVRVVTARILLFP